VRRKPYSVLLLDEIEKAHPDVFNILLQIFEDGRLTDAQGRTVDFRHTIIIMTSNIGAAEIAKDASYGFSLGDEATGLSYDDMKSRIMGELKKVFRPELINRIDEIVVFHKLTRDEIKSIVDLMLSRVRTNMTELELQLEVTEGMKELLADKGWDPAMGARPLRRAIQRYVEDPVADKVLAEKIEPGSTIMVERLPEEIKGGPNDGLEVEIKIVKPKKPRAKKKAPVAVGAESAEETSDSSASDSDTPELPEETGLDESK
jgi:ATP-dependent Clp protease ATP-binding subunit ClpC